METCDRCGTGVAATTTFVLASMSQLKFCGHHTRAFAPKLEPMSMTVMDLVDGRWVERVAA
jgi:hypothetical protein